MSNLSRRSLVASAAALPALALPAVAASTNPELLALGERLKPLFPRVAAARLKSRALSDEACEGLTNGFGWEKHPDHALWQERLAKNGHDQAYDEWNTADEEMNSIAEEILKIPAIDPMGESIHAAAALALNDEPENAYHLEDILWKIAARAGFERPPEWGAETEQDAV
jgi:hypothetical protein